MNNRIIKFRIWDNLKKQWCSNQSIWRMKTNDKGIGEISPPAIYFNQHPEGLTYQQLTGLQDKNGKEIYEGDIVRVQNYRYHLGQHKVELIGDFETYPVEWRDCGMWNISRNDISDASILYEVIGNIYKSSK